MREIKFRERIVEILHKYIIDIQCCLNTREEKATQSKVADQLHSLLNEAIGEDKCYFKRDFTRIKDYEKAKIREEGYNQAKAEIRDKVRGEYERY